MTPQLTKAEEQVMQILWEIEEGAVHSVLEKFNEPRPARTTVATVLNILENKGFVRHKNSGKINIYAPVLKKKDYSKSRLSEVLRNYFDDSFASLASFFVRENNMTMEDFDLLLADTRDALKAEQNTKPSN
ncbi:MAG: BlaI/MecI/CopY family transcriptional regulator [Dysgonamonadaceae bacterium]|jgi:predicted transcriptional regulator|nr:BlaI/MecI/CopY family transcriptional regulator [Dysgonamonadaceae bacterium]